MEWPESPQIVVHHATAALNIMVRHRRWREGAPHQKHELLASAGHRVAGAARGTALDTTGSGSTAPKGRVD